MKAPLEDRLLANRIVDANDCWRWQLGLDSQGYPKINVGRRTLGAHRISYQVFVGPIPDDLQLDHTCHSNDLTCVGGPTCTHRSCINPNHLEPVTTQENTARGAKVRATACKRGHEYTPESTRRTPNGERWCRRCDVIRQREYRIRKSATPKAAAA